MSAAGKLIKRIFRILRFVVFFFFISTVVVTIAYRFVRPPVTPLQLIRVAEQMVDGEKVAMKRHWVKLEDISPNMTRAVIAAEDNNFLKHHGLDFIAIKKAQK